MRSGLDIDKLLGIVLDSPAMTELLKKEMPSQEFNLFSTLHSIHDERRLHSRFIEELLNPNGKHGHGNAFLLLFLDVLFGQPGGAKPELKHDVVMCIRSAKKFRTFREYKNIDILIRGTDQDRWAVVIENKIYARDQERQLKRYYEAMLEEGVTTVIVIYLSLNGRQPDEYSCSGVPPENLICLSYKVHVFTWLSRCLELDLGEALRSSILQYRALTTELTAAYLPRELIMNTKEKLKQSDEMLVAAKAISEAYIEAKIDLQLEFWQHLRQNVEGAGERTLTDLDWSVKTSLVPRYYQDQRNNKRYGLNIVAYENESAIERVMCNIEVDTNTYFGVYVLNGTSMVPFSSDDRYEQLLLALQNRPGLSGWAIGEPRKYFWKHTDPMLNFEEFTVGPSIISPKDIEKYARKIADDARQIVQAVREESRHLCQ